MENKLTSFKVDMTAKDVELKKALVKNERVNERLKVLTDQVGTIKALVVEEFKSSEAYDDNNTKYFLVDFELLRKQAKEKYPDLDFDVFQPYEDDESMMPAEGGNDGTTSVILSWIMTPLHEFFFLPKQSLRQCVFFCGAHFGGRVISEQCFRFRI